MIHGCGKRGQSTLEWVVLFVVIIAALIAMQVYLKRGMQGRLRSTADQMGEQFSPGYTISNITTCSFSNSLEETGTVTPGITQVIIDNQAQNTFGYEVVQSMGNEYWGK